jgi:hypothetical protein
VKTKYGIDRIASREVKNRIADTVGVDRERVHVWVLWTFGRHGDRRITVTVQALSSPELNTFVEAMKTLIPPGWNWTVQGDTA